MANSDYIERVGIENLGCIKKIDVTLTPLHAFIGPNDSGKSTILRGIESGVNLRSLKPSNGNLTDQALNCLSKLAHIDLKLIITFGYNEEQISFYMKKAKQRTEEDMPLTGPFNSARLVRFDPDTMKRSSPLITEGRGVSLFSERGEGLAAVYDSIRDRNDEHFREISQQVLAMFENIERLQLKATTGSYKALQIKLKSGEEIPADQMSEGLLYFLGFAALPYLEPTSVLLVEEPENGLHPARIKEVMRVLRKVSQTTQVILATHSPLVINEMMPEEVSLVTRTPEDGTKVVCIKETPNFAERSKIYSLGELWLSYADGDREAPLMDPEEP